MRPMKYLILGFYQFVSIDDPKREVQRHKDFLEKRDVRARIYLSEQGVNGQLSAPEGDAEEYMEWLKGDGRFASMPFKVDSYPEHIFPKLTVKYRRELVALNVPVEAEAGGERVSPARWRRM